MPVTKRTRYEVLKRDNHTCRYCGATAPDAIITIDHVTPTALGGTDEPSNLVTACRDCNYGKGSTSPDAGLVEDVSQDAIRWAAAIKLAAERMSARDEPLFAYIDVMEKELDMYGGPSAVRVPDDWRDSCEQFFRAGLPVDQVVNALAVAMSKSTVSWSSKWRYTCGICWGRIRDIREEAERIVSESE